MLPGEQIFVHAVELLDIQIEHHFDEPVFGLELLAHPGAAVGRAERGVDLDRQPFRYRHDRRVEHILALRPEICSLDMGSMNFGPHVFANIPAHLSTMAASIREAGVKPELEVFEAGHIQLAAKMVADGAFDAPQLFQIVLGVPWGAPSTPEAMLFMRNLLPPGANWAGFGIGRAEFPFVALAAMLGGHCRVGLEDNLYLEKGVLAPSNAALVEKAVRVQEVTGATVATSAQAREILGLRGRP